MDKATIVVLAKSFKPGGRCIAGRYAEMNPDGSVTIGGWFRPVPDDSTGCGSLSNQMFTYSDGNEVKVLDIVEIPLKSKASVPGQPENHIIDESQKWSKITVMDAKTIRNIVEDVSDAWYDPDSNSNVVSDAHEVAGKVSQSLMLIQPENLIITLSNEYDDYKKEYKRKICASFVYKGKAYSGVSITCPSTRIILTNQYPVEGGEPKSMSLRNGDNYVLCLSLSPKFGPRQEHFKLVAAVFDYDGYLQRKYAA